MPQQFEAGDVAVTQAMVDRLPLRFVAVDADEIRGEMNLRYEVLRRPLGHNRASVAFAFDTESLHLLAMQDSKVVGCVLFHPESTVSGRLYQMAIRPDFQSFGLGRRLVNTLESRLILDGFQSITLHARDHAAPFYTKLGYGIEGEPFDEVGIEHYIMTRDLHANLGSS